MVEPMRVTIVGSERSSGRKGLNLLITTASCYGEPTATTARGGLSFRAEQRRQHRRCPHGNVHLNTPLCLWGDHTHKHRTCALFHLDSSAAPDSQSSPGSPRWEWIKAAASRGNQSSDQPGNHPFFPIGTDLQGLFGFCFCSFRHCPKG